MTRAYLRLDPAFDERKEHYPDGAFRALVEVLCLAERQVQRGRFRSVDYLRRLLGKRGKWVAYLMENGDLLELAGRVYVDGWDEWQEGDHTVGERVRRIRSKRARNGDGNGGGNGSVYGSPHSAGVSAGAGAGADKAPAAGRSPADVLKFSEAMRQHGYTPKDVA